jgi:hypothetical protein
MTPEEFRKQLASGIDIAETVEAAALGMQRHLALHMQHDAVAYAAMREMLVRQDSPGQILEAFDEHVDHDRTMHEKLMGEVDYVAQISHRTVGFFYHLRNEFDSDQEARASSQPIGTEVQDQREKP